MANAHQIQARGAVIEVLPHGAYRAELANGHRCVIRSGARDSAAYLPGDLVRVEFHPYDLSRGWIVGPG